MKLKSTSPTPTSTPTDVTSLDEFSGVVALKLWSISSLMQDHDMVVFESVVQELISGHMDPILAEAAPHRLSVSVTDQNLFTSDLRRRTRMRRALVDESYLNVTMTINITMNEESSSSPSWNLISNEITNLVNQTSMFSGKKVLERFRESSPFFKGLTLVEIVTPFSAPPNSLSNNINPKESNDGKDRWVTIIIYCGAAAAGMAIALFGILCVRYMYRNHSLMICHKNGSHTQDSDSDLNYSSSSVVSFVVVFFALYREQIYLGMAS
jgi:hypothetical protein